MSDDVPVEPMDLVAVIAVSFVGGLLLASWTLTPEFAADFAVSVLAGTVTLSFFLFIPVMGIRLFLEERHDD